MIKSSLTKKILLEALISLAFGIIITYGAFLFTKGNCANKTIDMPGAVSWYENQVCKSNYNDIMKGYPLPIYSYNEAYPICINCDIPTYNEKIYSSNIAADITIWSILSFGIIVLIKKVKGKKNAK